MTNHNDIPPSRSKSHKALLAIALVSEQSFPDCFDAMAAADEISHLLHAWFRIVMASGTHTLVCVKENDSRLNRADSNL